MKHFIVEITYTAPLEQIAEVRAEHRAFLQGGFDCGLLLFSGPQHTMAGGMAVARAELLQELQAFFQKDPYNLKGYTTYRYVEFEPVKSQPFMQTWLQTHA